MISVSQAYKDLVKTAVRPKIQPVITVSGIDNEGNEVFLKWESKDIKSLAYKREIDPIGRSLPYMELTWTEIYAGDFSALNYPEKYKNIIKHMKVELSFVQDLSFFNSWKTLFNSGKTWAELFNIGKTWKNLKKEIESEKITFPSLFLESKPTIEGNTITWKARDLIFFLDEKQTELFYGDIPFENPIKCVLLNARSAFLNSKPIFNSLTKIGNFPFGDYGDLGKYVIFDDSTKNILKNYCNLRTAYWDFSDDIIELRKCETLFNQQPEYDFNSNVMFKHTEITQGVDVSQYSFKRYRVYKEPSETYEKVSPDETIILETADPQNPLLYGKYYFKEYGITENQDVYATINYAVSSKYFDNITVTPIKKNAIDCYINKNSIGEPFVEDNPINPYDTGDSYIIERSNVISKYFDSSIYTMSFECLPNVALTTGDCVSVKTNLIDDFGNKIAKNGVIVSLELNYNGALKQKVIVHEVPYDN